MTANQIFETAAAYLTQSMADSDDLAEFVPMWLSVLLAESLPTENQLRRWEGREELAAAPLVTAGTMGEDIPYHEDILRIALPYGLAGDFWRDDDDDYRANDFRARYISALSDAIRAEGESVRDVYADTYA